MFKLIFSLFILLHTALYFLREQTQLVYLLTLLLILFYFIISVRFVILCTGYFFKLFYYTADKLLKEQIAAEDAQKIYDITTEKKHLNDVVSLSHISPLHKKNRRL